METWQAFIELQAEGLVRAIGVSNFQPAHLERIVAETGVVPAINQVELHPYFQQAGLRHEHEELGHRHRGVEPARPRAGARRPRDRRDRRGSPKTPAQAIIRWHLQLGNVVIPKSVTPERIEENFDVFDFELSDGQMEAIRELDAGKRIGPDPDTFVRPKGSEPAGKFRGLIGKNSCLADMSGDTM